MSCQNESGRKGGQEGRGGREEGGGGRRGRERKLKMELILETIWKDGL